MASRRLARSLLFLLPALTLLVPASPAASLRAADGPLLDVLPQDVLGSLSIRNLDAVQKRGDELQQELGLPQHFRLSTLFEMGINFLGIRRGVDREGVFSIMLAGPPPSESDVEWLDGIVIRVPFTDADEMAANFGLAAGSLKPGVIHSVGKRQFDRETYVTRQGSAVLYGLREASLQAVAKSPPLKTGVPSDPQRRIENSHLLFHLHLAALNNDRAEVGKHLREWTAQQRRGWDDELAADFEAVGSELVDHTQNALVSVSIDNGLSIRTQLTFSDGLSERATAALAEWGRRTAPPTLRGLPEGNLLYALTKAADVDRQATLAPIMLQWMLDGFLAHSPLRNRVLDVSEPYRDTYLGVFDELWGALRRLTMAVYLNDNGEEQGLVGVLAILEPQSPEQFRRQLADLVRFAQVGEYQATGAEPAKVGEEEIQTLIQQLGDTTFKVRRAATLRLRLIGDPAVPHLEAARESDDREVVLRAEKLLEQIRKSLDDRRRHLVDQGLPHLPRAEFVYHPAQRTIAGFPVDVLVASWKPADERVETALRETFGPSGHEILLVDVGDRIVVSVGSNHARLERCLQLLRDDKPGLEAQAAAFRRSNPDGHHLQMHWSLQRMEPLLPEQQRHRGGKVAEPRAPSPQVTSLGIDVSQGQLIGDLSLPIDELRLIATFLGMY